MQPQTPQQQSPDEVRRSNKKKLIWGLVCLLGPTLLLVGTLLIYALVNFLIATNTPSSGDCTESGAIVSGANCFPDSGSANQGVGKTIVNVIMFLVGAISVASWLPGIIGGIVLLATRKPVPSVRAE